MQIDEDLALALLNGVGSPTLRVYGWEPWAISLGWSQSFGDVHSSKASGEGVDVVRRPTGGRAILHANELTYTVVMPSKGESVNDMYREISSGLLAGLRLLGVPAVFETGSPHFPSLYKLESSAMCFVSSARWEIKVGNKKLVGSAQRRYRNEHREVVLQHGSLPLSADHLRIVEYLHISQQSKEVLRRELCERSTDLEEILDRRVEFEEVAPCMKEGFEKSWGIRFRENSQTLKSELHLS